MAYAVQYFQINSSAGYICWPKIASNDKTWDPRTENPSSSNYKWTIRIDSGVTFDLINDAGFAEYDSVIPSVNVEAGEDATCLKSFVVAANGKTAVFTAKGTTLNSGLNYDGIRS